jgi:Avidin family
MSRSHHLTAAALVSVAALAGCRETAPPEAVPDPTTVQPVAETPTSVEGQDTSAADSFPGKWKNQRDSTIELKVDGKGAVTGTYTTIVGTTGKPFTKPLAGKVRGDQIVFYVDWDPYSMAAWVGQILTDSSGNKALDTVWLNGKDIDEKSEPNDGWSHVRVNGDRFTKI